MTPKERSALADLIRQRYASATAGLKKRGKGYKFDGRPMVGVTTALKVIDKSGPLVSWATRLQVEADVAAAFRAYEHAGFREGLTFDEFKAIFEQFADGEKAHQKALKDAGDLGTDLHSLIDWRCQALLGNVVSMPTVRDEAMWLFSKWDEWAKDSEFMPILTEAPVFSRLRGYAGTLDNLAFAWGEVCLLDWKTGGDFYDEFNLQNVGYREALKEMGVTDGIDVRGLLIRVPKAEDDPRPFEQKWVPDWSPADGFNPVEYQWMSTAWEHVLGLYPWKKRADDEGLARWRARKDEEKRLQAEKEAGKR